MIAFYYVLHIGEYTIKDKCNNTKQTVQFKFKDVSFYKKNSRGNLRYLPRDASDKLIMTANGATLKLDNQKNGWKGVCVYHESNGASMHCPIRAITRRFLHLRSRGADSKTFLSAYYDDMGKRFDVTNEDVSRALKSAAAVLDYPTAKGIPIDRIDTHSRPHQQQHYCCQLRPHLHPIQNRNDTVLTLLVCEGEGCGLCKFLFSYCAMARLLLPTQNTIYKTIIFEQASTNDQKLCHEGV
jgi:hypothetical protein